MTITKESFIEKLVTTDLYDRWSEGLTYDERGLTFVNMREEDMDVTDKERELILQEFLCIQVIDNKIFNLYSAFHLGSDSRGIFNQVLTLPFLASFKGAKVTTCNFEDTRFADRRIVCKATPLIKNKTVDMKVELITIDATNAGINLASHFNIKIKYAILNTGGHNVLSSFIIVMNRNDVVELDVMSDDVEYTDFAKEIIKCIG